MSKLSREEARRIAAHFGMIGFLEYDDKVPHHEQGVELNDGEFVSIESLARDLRIEDPEVVAFAAVLYVAGADDAFGEVE